MKTLLSKLIGPLRPSDSPSLNALIEHAKTVSEAGSILNRLVYTSNPDLRAKDHDLIVSLEKTADIIEKKGIDDIHRAIILPFDRSMLLRALELSDDVIDNIRKVSFEITTSRLILPHEAKEAARAIELATKEMPLIPELLKRPEKNKDKIWSVIRKIHSHEKEADQAHRSMIENIRKLDGSSTTDIILTLRISDRLEAIADGCEDFAHECGRILSDNA